MKQVRSGIIIIIRKQGRNGIATYALNLRKKNVKEMWCQSSYTIKVHKLILSNKHVLYLHFLIAVWVDDVSQFSKLYLSQKWKRNLKFLVEMMCK